MGKVRSVRFNEQSERMFNIVKSYLSKCTDTSDSEIFSNGIRLQYDVIVKGLDSYFKEKMIETISNKQNIFSPLEKVCDILEVISISQGSTFRR